MTDMGRKRLDTMKIYAPIIGAIYKNYLIVQVMSTFHLLSSSGVTIIKTLRLTGASSGNTKINEMYSYMANEVSKGKKISETMSAVDTE